MNIITVIKKYLEYLKLKGFAQRSLSKYEWNLMTLATYCEKKEIKGIQDISKDHLKGFRDHLYSYIGIKHAKPMSEWTINNILHTLRKFFKYLEKNQILLINPFEDFPEIKRPDRLPDNIPSEEEMMQILKSPDLSKPRGIRDRAIMEVLYSTGIRRLECHNLTVFDVDLSQQILRVNQGKGKKDRLVPLGNKACEYLKVYLEKARPIWLPDADCKALFLSRKQLPLSGSSINDMLRKYGKVLKLKTPFTVHAFRKAAVTHMLKRGCHPSFLRKILGHSTNNVLRNYIKLTITDVKDMHDKKHPRRR